MHDIENQQRTYEEHSRRRHALNLVIKDILGKVEKGADIDREEVIYFSLVLVKDLPNPEGEIDRALRIVETARITNTLDDLKTIIEK